MIGTWSAWTISLVYFRIPLDIPYIINHLFYEISGLPHRFGKREPRTVLDVLRAWEGNGTMPDCIPTVLTNTYRRIIDQIICISMNRVWGPGKYLLLHMHR
ncbi:hypothetical protein F4811DRAFT_503032 [Daldinia bambusicola]|nr:hypothetical protein F4811DRAFT_503032 [Daldinia bambusicola]